MDMKYHSWLGRTINVIDSSDASLIGMKGLVLDETRETIVISYDEQKNYIDVDPPPTSNEYSHSLYNKPKNYLNKICIE